MSSTSSFSLSLFRMHSSRSCTAFGTTGTSCIHVGTSTDGCKLSFVSQSSAYRRHRVTYFGAWLSIPMKDGWACWSSWSLTTCHSPVLVRCSKLVLPLHQLFDIFQRSFLVEGELFDLILNRVPVLCHCCGEGRLWDLVRRLQLQISILHGKDMQ